MGVFDRLRRRGQGDGPDRSVVLGEDVLDLAAFGGWPGAMAQLVEPAQLDEVVAHLRGRAALPVGGPAWHAAHTPQMLHELRLVLAVRCALAPTERQRLTDLTGLADPVELLRTQAQLAQAEPPRHGRLRFADLERAAPALGWSPDDVLAVLLGEARSWETRRRLVLDAVPDRDDYVGRHLEQLRGALATPVRKEQADLWSRVGGLPAGLLARLLPEACAAAAASARALREPAEAVLRTLPPDDVVQGLQHVAITGRAAQTAQALDTLARLTEGERRVAVHAWAQTELGEHRSEAVREAVARLGALAARPAAARRPLPETRLADLEPITGLRLPGDGRAGELEQALNGRPASAPGHVLLRLLHVAVQEDRGLRRRLFPEHVARVLLRSAGLAWAPMTWLSDLWQVARPSPALIAAVAAHDRVAPRRAVETVAALHGVWPGAFTDAELAAWVDHAGEDVARAVLDRGDGSAQRGLLDALARVPQRPDHLDDALAEAAVNGVRADREALHRLLDSGHTHRVLPHLSSRAAAARRGAAEWLRAHPSADAVPALLAAARAERDDTALAAELTALEAAGADLDEFVSPEALAAQAARVLGGRTPVPRAVEWLDATRLPALTWADGTDVPLDVVRSFVVGTVRGRTVEPSPVLRRHTAAMDADRRRAFGRALLEAWLAEDTRTHSEAEARAVARSLAPNHHAWGQRGGHLSGYAGMTLQQVEDAITDAKRREIAGSATASKGLLALVAATAGGDVAERAMTYLRRHRGQRMSQGRSLLDLLAQVDDPAAVQALMAVATRFRPKGLQDHAEAQARLLAERRGWTLEDLADRSVPDGGFDAQGRAVLDYGGRTFTARLADDLSVTLVADETGRPVKSLPAARSGEDAEQVAAVRAELTAAKKDLKATARLQPDRLHLAMCTQREWSTDDFARYVAGHPVMVRLATRLVWRASGPDGDVRLFRPLTDGTLLDAADDDVELADDAVVTLAHDRLLDDAEREAWRTHLADYEVAALFPQLDRPLVELRDGQTTLDHVAGTVLPDTTLRAQLDRHGWRIGQVEDGGVAGEIVRLLPGSGLVGVLDLGHEGLSAARFDGHWKVTLGTFHVVADGGSWDRSAARPLTEVPPVLLSELVAELVALAGSGR